MSSRPEHAGDSGSQRPAGILFVLPWGIDALGGVNEVVINLMRHAQRSQVFRPVFLENSAASSTLGPGPEGIPLIRYLLPSPCASASPVRSMLGFLWRLPAALWRLRRMIRAYNITLINVHYPTPAALTFCVLRALQLYRGKIVLSFHGLDVRTAANGSRFERRVWRLLLRLCDASVACSAALAREVAALHGSADAQVKVIHNGIDPDALADSCSTHEGPQALDGGPYILSVGTFEHKKGQDVLIEAFRLLADEYPAHRLILAGRTAEWLPHLRSQVERLGLRDRVLFSENVPHARIGAFFEKAEIFCLPSRIEPFGIVLLEAGYFAVPVVASETGGIVEIVRDGTDGFLVPPEEPKALAQTLKRLLDDAGLRQRVACSLQSRVKQQFTWSQAFRAYLELV